jgi:AraC-like DNA-binding protein
VSIAEIARRCQASQNRLMAAFRSRYGESMIAFRNRLAIRNALWRFDTTQATIAEIRQAVGIEDPHHFNKLFHKMVGISPSAYRQRFKPVLSSMTIPEQQIGGLPKNPRAKRVPGRRRR